jgi:tetraacyldisaccharide 4'-kinase
LVNRLEKLWYGSSGAALLLAPLAWLYCGAAVVRRRAYAAGLLRVGRLPVPVVVVGNVTVGGTGKTPLVAWLAAHLRESGFRPGIVSRGYGGRARSWPQPVHADSDPAVVGDEAVLLVRRTGCPMTVGPDRVAAARALLEENACSVILSDDGLQHYALARDVEIAVVDGTRRLGNGLCLPAGPLREPHARLGSVDLIVVNGAPGPGEYGMRLENAAPRRLLNDEPGSLEDFRERPVHAIAGIGHPARFFGGLRALGLQVIEHAFPDHHAYAPGDLELGDDLPLLMTEKDAVKCRRFAKPHHWYLPVDARPDPRLAERVLALIDRSAHG